MYRIRSSFAVAFALVFALLASPASAAQQYAIPRISCGGPVDAPASPFGLSVSGRVGCIAEYSVYPSWSTGGTWSFTGSVGPIPGSGGPWTMPSRTFFLNLIAEAGTTVSFFSGFQVQVTSTSTGQVVMAFVKGSFVFDPPPLPPDTTPPSINVGDMEVVATSVDGAVVFYPTMAFDDRDGMIAMSCSPPSGTIFPIGSTTVTCTATDSSGNTGAGSFRVTVLGAEEQAKVTIELLASPTTELPAGTQKSLISTLTAAQSSFSSGSTTAGCGQLTSFANKVNAQTGKSIDAALADQLNAAVTQMRSTAGC